VNESPSVAAPTRQSANWRRELYFGIHYDLHATADDTELGSRLTAEHLRAELQRIRPDWVQCDCKGHPGYTSYPTRVGTSSPGIVRDALRIHRDVTRELGMPLVVHYSGLMDGRAIELHPEWAVLKADGSHDELRICPRSDYRDELLVPQLLEIVREYDVDGIWVDGDNWASQPCWCERCSVAYGAEPPREEADPDWHSWLAFHRASVIAHINAYRVAVREADPTVAVASNGTGSAFAPGDLETDVDWLSADMAPTVSVLLAVRSFAHHGLPWEVMTWGFITPFPGHPITDQKSPTQLRRELALGLSCGGGASVYELSERSGHLVSWRQQTLADLGAWARERRPVVEDTTSVPQVAVLHSERHHYLHAPPLFLPGDGDQPVTGALHALLDARMHVDVINEEELGRRGAEYALIVVPEQEDLSAMAIERLTDYARAGGRVVVSGARVAEVLPELTGAKPSGEPIHDHVLLRSGETSFKASGSWQPVEPTTATAVSRLLRGWEPTDETDDVVITANDVGSGRVVAVHGTLFTHHATYNVPRSRDLIVELCRLTGAELDLAVDSAPGVHVTLRRKDSQTIVHLVNMDGWHPLAPVTTHVDSIRPTGLITVRLRTAQPPASVHLAPGGEVLTSSYADGWMTVHVPTVDIHAAVVFEA
jgi:hypothetical protein